MGLPQKVLKDIVVFDKQGSQLLRTGIELPANQNVILKGIGKEIDYQIFVNYLSQLINRALVLNLFHFYILINQC